MRIIRHTAPTTRQALRGIRERLGENAVILSSRRVPEGVEVTAGADAHPQHLAEVAAASERIVPASAPPVLPPAPPPNLAPAPLAPAAVAAAPSHEAMSQELRLLRRMLETQLEQLAWSDLTRRQPVHAQLMRELAEMGVTHELVTRILEQLPADTDLASGRRFAFTALSQYLPVTGESWPERGGRVAFIGATGVGKTTSLAKVAVRWTLRHGARELALIAADAQRVGAQDQIRALGQLLGAAVYAPDNFADLPVLLTQLSHHRLILIDTPGAGLRDAHFSSRLAILANAASRLESALVLSASTQAGALEDAVKRFAPANPSCVVLTKLDEAVSLGGALSVIARAQLRLAYISEGQRVPEDLRPARALELVSAAVRLAKASGAAADEDLLRRRFGKVAHVGT